mgnify:CR=1 FL=1
MKKILSIFLALILLVSSVVINGSAISNQSSEAVLSDPDDKLITIFDSNAYVTKDSSTTNTNSVLVTPEDKGYWLGGTLGSALILLLKTDFIWVKKEKPIKFWKEIMLLLQM